jgi:hypothetical protein
MELRRANDLTAFTPPEKFLAGNFIADEMNPVFIFGTVKDFAGSRKCAATWLIERGAKDRPVDAAPPENLQEYTINQEDDSPDKEI